MLGSLEEGLTEVHGFLKGTMLWRLTCLQGYGVQIEGPKRGCAHTRCWYAMVCRPLSMSCIWECGTAMRLLAGLMAGQNFDTVLTGDRSLSKRPMNRVAIPLKAMGIDVETQDDGKPPMTVRGGQPQAIAYEMPMASAQVKSCIVSRFVCRW